MKNRWSNYSVLFLSGEREIEGLGRLKHANAFRRYNLWVEQPWETNAPSTLHGQKQIMELLQPENAYVCWCLQSKSFAIPFYFSSSFTHIKRDVKILGRIENLLNLTYCHNPLVKDQRKDVMTDLKKKQLLHQKSKENSVVIQK